MINQNDDPLIAEIEKRTTELKALETEYDDYGEFEQCRAFERQRLELERVMELVKQDRARQQAEKEKMIAELKDASTSMQIDNMGNTATAIELEDVIAIIQGKEQKEERVIE